MFRTLSLLALVAPVLCGSFVSTYYPEYSSMKPASLPYDKLSNVDWFVAAPLKNGTLQQADVGPTFSALDGRAIREVVKRSHAQNVTVTLVVGGWTGSRYFSSLVANNTSRKAFADILVKTLKDYRFDGLQLDWEFPQGNGVTCNEQAPADTDNLILFFQELRQQLGNPFRLSSAMPASGYNNQTKAQGRALAKVLTDITIMAYDFSGPTWADSTAPNAPLRVCNAEVLSQSVETSIGVWRQAGFKTSQLILGMPSYGYGFAGVRRLVKTKNDDGTPTTVYNDFKTSFGGKTADEGKDVCGEKQENGGQWLYSELIGNGWLDRSGTKGGKGWTRYFDACTQTPYLYNPTKRQFIAYDDAQSIAAKSKFAKQKKLKGIVFFDSTGDYKSQLLDAARKAFL